MIIFLQVRNDIKREWLSDELLVIVGGDSISKGFGRCDCFNQSYAIFFPKNSEQTTLEEITKELTTIKAEIGRLRKERETPMAELQQHKTENKQKAEVAFPVDVS